MFQILIYREDSLLLQRALPQSTSLTAPSAEGASVRYTSLCSHIIRIVRFYGYLQRIISQSPLPQKRVARHSRDGCSSPILIKTNIPDKSQFVGLNIFYCSSSYKSLFFISSSSAFVGQLSAEYIFSIGYHQTGPRPPFP